MQLPELPRQLNKREAKVTPKVFKWFENNWKNSAAIEVKTGSTLKNHQLKALKKVAKGTFSYKIPDMGNRICFDGFFLKDADSFIVTCSGNLCDVLNVKNNERFKIKV